MQCLRCNTEMKHYEFNQNFNILGSEHKPHPFSTINRVPHNPHSVYICDKCGYMEFSTNYCDNPDI